MKTLFVVSVMCISVVSVGLGSSDKYECNQLVNQSKQFSGFFVSKSQYDGCKAIGIIINADIK